MHAATAGISLVTGSLALCAPALADVNFLSASWEASGTGRVVEPGFTDLAAAYDRSGVATTSTTLMRLSNHPPFGSPYIDNTLAVDIEEDGPMFQNGQFRIFSRGSGAVSGLGHAIDIDSVITAIATIEVVDEPELLMYDMNTSGGSVVTPLLTGTNHRTSRMRITPQGGSPLIDEFRESTFTGGSHLFSGRITLDPGLYELALEITVRIQGSDDIGAARSDAGANISWPGIPAPGTLAVLLPCSLVAPRRRR